MTCPGAFPYADIDRPPPGSMQRRGFVIGAAWIIRGNSRYVAGDMGHARLAVLPGVYWVWYKAADA